MDRIKKQDAQESGGEKKQLKPGRRWLLTVHPETFVLPFSSDPSSIAFLGTWRQDNNIDYLIACIERGAKTNRLHMHIYLELPYPQRISWVRKIFGGKGDYQLCRGTQEEAIGYINGSREKPGVTPYGVVEYGTKHASNCTESGGMYDSAVAMVLDGISIVSIARSIGGGILPQISNLCRLKAQVAEERQNERINNRQR
jgi:hypothetical protein